jgi:hypothetical protein
MSWGMITISDVRGLQRNGYVQNFSKPFVHKKKKKDKSTTWLARLDNVVPVSGMYVASRHDIR